MTARGDLRRRAGAMKTTCSHNKLAVSNNNFVLFILPVLVIIYWNLSFILLLLFHLSIRNRNTAHCRFSVAFIPALQLSNRSFCKTRFYIAAAGVTFFPKCRNNARKYMSRRACRLQRIPPFGTFGVDRIDVKNRAFSTYIAIYFGENTWVQDFALIVFCPPKSFALLGMF